MRTPIILAAILLTACATKPPPQWVKPGGDQREVYACQIEAEKAAVSSDPNALMAAVEKAERRNKVMDLCMRSKGVDASAINVIDSRIRSPDQRFPG